MSINISDIKQASFDGPTRFGLHSVEGFGKTTLAAFFPSPVFLSPERGFPRDLPFRPHHFPESKTWEDVLGSVGALVEQPHDFKTLVIDTVDWVEPLIHAYVCERDSGRKTELNKGGHKLLSIEDYGFGKGYVASQEEFRRLIAALDILQAKRGMHVAMLMHSHVKTFRNPSGEDFDRWQPKMHERIARIVIEWCENVMFGYFEVVAEKTDEQQKLKQKAKGVSTGRRILGTRQNAMYDAKNRFNLPDTVELNSPAEMVPYLIGTHLGAKSAEATPPKKTPAPPTKDEDDPTDRGRMTSTKGNGKQASPPPADATPPQQPSPQAPSDAKPAQGLSAEMEKDIADMLADCEGALGKKYRTKVEGWLSRAGFDTAKVNSIFETVRADMKAHANNKQANA